MSQGKPFDVVQREQRLRGDRERTVKQLLRAAMGIERVTQRQYDKRASFWIFCRSLTELSRN